MKKLIEIKNPDVISKEKCSSIRGGDGRKKEGDVISVDPETQT